MKKRLLALALALMLVLTLLPSVAMAKEESFADVRPADWYYNAVCFAAENGLMSGTGAGFAPDAPTTRAMLWTILARLDGQTAKHTGPDWYAAAQLWAVRNDISDGTEPDGTITREQLAAMLYRFAQRKGLVRAASPADLSAFTDAASVSAYAQEAMQWAVANGLIAGMDGRLVPQGSATRAQIAQILSRMCEKWSLLPQSNAAILAGAGVFQPPEHKHTWSAAVPNSDGTHTSSCECGETMTEYCTLVPQKGTKSWSCSVCGFTVEGEDDAGVSTWDELEAAVEAGRSPIYLAGDITAAGPIACGTNTVVHGGGHTLRFVKKDGVFQNALLNAQDKELTLTDLVLDGTGCEHSSYLGVVNGETDSVLKLENVTIQNFRANRIIRSVSGRSVELTNVTIKNNTLYDANQPGLVWLVNTLDSKLKRVVITDNQAEKTNRAIAICLYGDNNVQTLYAEELEVKNNENFMHVLATYGCNHSDHITLESGMISDNMGTPANFFVACMLTIGENMTVKNNMIFNNDNDHGDPCVLTNNGTIIGDIAEIDWAVSRGLPVYTGSGTHIGTKANIEVR